MCCYQEVMPRATTKRKSTSTRGTGGSKRRVGAGGSQQLSTRTKKQIDSLPQHAQHIYKKVHASAIKQYQSPEKRRGGKKEKAEQGANKTTWAAGKKKKKKKG